MNQSEVVYYLQKKLLFSSNAINKLRLFHDLLIGYNKNYNLISKNTENKVWFRHILDSAQIIPLFKHSEGLKVGDLGSGAGFPGVVLAIFDENNKFHVKLYEKSPVKREFLMQIKSKLKLKFDIEDNVYKGIISDNLIIARAFKKLEEIFNISREIINKPHKMIILKGKNAQNEINNLSLKRNYSYNLIDSITDIDSKIIIVDVKL